MLDGAPVGNYQATKITSNHGHRDAPRGTLGERKG